MKIEVIALCDAATEQAGKLNILGAFDSIQSKKFPFSHPQCAFVCRIRFNRIEAGTHSFKVDFIDVDGNSQVPPLEAKMSIGFPEGVDSQVSNLILNMQGLKFDNPGKFLFEIAVNNRQEASLPVYVRKLEQVEETNPVTDDTELP